MAWIVECKCTNKECDFEIQFFEGAPVWHPDVPMERRKIPNANRGYIIETTNQRLCINCHELVYLESATYVCPNCASVRTFVGPGDQCPKCKNGVLKDSGLGAKF